MKLNSYAVLPLIEASAVPANNKAAIMSDRHLGIRKRSLAILVNDTFLQGPEIIYYRRMPWNLSCHPARRAIPV
jgi:hypothetical protein